MPRYVCVCIRGGEGGSQDEGCVCVCVARSCLTIVFLPWVDFLSLPPSLPPSLPRKQDVVRKMSKYDNFFVNVMMVEELGLQVPDPDDDIVKEGVVMFLAFAGFGAMPLLGYALMPLCFPHLGSKALFNIACVVTALTLFVMGAVKSKFSTRGWLHSGLEMLLLGGVCALMAYEIGHLVSSLVGVGEV